MRGVCRGMRWGWRGGVGRASSGVRWWMRGEGMGGGVGNVGKGMKWWRGCALWEMGKRFVRWRWGGGVSGVKVWCFMRLCRGSVGSLRIDDLFDH